MVQYGVCEKVHWPQGRILSYVTPIDYLGNAFGDMENLSRGNIAPFMFQHEKVSFHDTCHRLPHLLQCHAQGIAVLLTVASYHLIGSLHIISFPTIKLHQMKILFQRTVKILRALLSVNAM